MADHDVDHRDVEHIARSLETLLRLNASRRVHAKQAAAAGVAMSRPGFLLLRRIHEEGPLPLGELSRLADMDPAATSRQIRQLEDDGLVVRYPSPEDGRVTLVKVTPNGGRARRRIAEVLDRHMWDVLDHWSPGDRRQLAGLLARLVEDLRAVHYRSALESRSA